MITMKKQNKLSRIILNEYENNRAQSNTLCLSVIDIDGFKNINAAIGRAPADAVINILNAAIERHAHFPVNIYADNFVFMSKTQTEALESSKQILDIFSNPMDIKGLKVLLNLSIGISSERNDITTELEIDELLAESEKAHQVSKDGLGEKINRYNHLPQETIYNEVEIGYEMKKSLAEEDFCIYLQPKLTPEGKLVSAEALLRWDHPDHGVLPPSEFIAYAEKTWAIRELTRESIRLTCRALEELAKHDIDIKIAFNMSTKVLGFETEMVDWLREEESVTKWAHKLEMEILEEGENAHNYNTIRNIEQVGKLGITIALDDFGTGMSSLTYLLSFDAKVLKIDKSIIDKIETKRGSKIISSVIKLTKELGIQSVAEGVETQEQLDILREMDVDLIQGYFFSKPLEIREFIEKYKK